MKTRLLSPSALRLSFTAIAAAITAALVFSPVAAAAKETKKPAKEESAEKESAGDESEEKEKPGDDERDEDAALAQYKADMGKIKKWSQAKEKEAKDDPTAGLAVIKDLFAKVKGVRTDGLPDDLGSAHAKMVGSLKKMSAEFKDLPEDKTAILGWLQEKAKSDPDFGARMTKLGEEMKATGESLKKLGKKYDIPELDFDDKDSKADGKKAGKEEEDADSEAEGEDEDKEEEAEAEEKPKKKTKK